ncbi:MAG: alpha/beta fold hydrolase [Acidobacteriota bacterium]
MENPEPRSGPKKSTVVRKAPLAVRAAMRVLGVVAPPLAARAAETLFRIPPRHVPADGERELLASGRPLRLSVRGGTIAAWSWGEGPPVLLVHGWGSRGARLGSFVAPLLAAGHSVLAFDAPGHGDAESRQSSLPEFLFAVEAAHAAHGPFAGVVAHSIGGAAVTLAMDRGVSAGRALMLAPSSDPASYPKLFSAAAGVSEGIRLRMEARVVRRFGMPWSEFDVLAAARRQRAPLLVIHDATDTDVPWRDGAALAAAWPGANLVTTDGLGHRRIVHDPGVVARGVAFLEDAAASRPAAAPAAG